MSISRIVFTTLLLSLALPAAASAQDLERAYKKELAYLQAQKRALQERVEDIEQATREQSASASAEVDRLQGRLVSLSLQGDRLEEQLTEAQRETGRIEDQSDTLLNTMEQARSSLESYDVSVAETPEGEAPAPADVQATFAQAATVLEAGGAVREESGGFFLADGSKVDGKLVHVGRVATYGVSPDGSGALAPAGEGRLKLWPADTSETARAIAAGDLPAELGVFLYENLDKPVDQKEGKTWIEFVNAGGVIGWVIVGIGLLALLLALIRALTLFALGRGRRVADDVTPLVVRGRIEEARKVAGNTAGVTAEVVATTLKHLDRSREVVEDAVAEAILRQAPRIERFGSIILVFAAVSPLLGLLGTVTGMISTFDVITEYGTGDPKMLSGGISEALITTQLGLVVAIPALLLGNLLNGRANALLENLEQSALRVLNAKELGAVADGSLEELSDEELSARGLLAQVG